MCFSKHMIILTLFVMGVGVRDPPLRKINIVSNLMKISTLGFFTFSDAGTGRHLSFIIEQQLAAADSLL